MLPPLLVLLGFPRPALQPTGADRTDQTTELADLQHRAEAILSQNQKNEISTSEARRRVQLLLKDLEKWSAKHEVDLDHRARTFSSPAVGSGEILTADRCPLFYEEKLQRLCPLDLSHSEVWGARVVFCRYLCAPETKEESEKSAAESGGLASRNGQVASSSRERR